MNNTHPKQQLSFVSHLGYLSVSLNISWFILCIAIFIISNIHLFDLHCLDFIHLCWTKIILVLFICFVLFDLCAYIYMDMYMCMYIYAYMYIYTYVYIILNYWFIYVFHVFLFPCVLNYFYCFMFMIHVYVRRHKCIFWFRIHLFTCILFIWIEQSWSTHSHMGTCFLVDGIDTDKDVV